MTTNRDLPDGWRWVRFGDVVREVKIATKDPEADGLSRVVGLDHLDPEVLPLRRWNELEDLPDGTSFTRVFRAGQVLFGKRRAYQRKVAVASFDGICSSDILVFEPSTDELLSEFLPYVAQSDGFFDHALGTSAGSLSPRTKFQELAKYEFALPSPEDQRHMVDTLAAAQRELEAYQAVLAALSGLRESVLSALAAQAVPFRPLGELAHVVSGESWSSEAEVSTPAEGAVPVIGISSLRPEGHVDMATETFVMGLQSKKSLFQADEMTLLVIRTNGNADRIGNVYQVEGMAEGRALSAFIFGCRFQDANQRDLAFEYMRGRRFQNWATSLVAGSTGLKNLPIRELRKIPIPVVDNGEVVDHLETLRAIRRVEEAGTEAAIGTRRLTAVIREHLLEPVDV